MMTAENIDQSSIDPKIPIILGVTGHRNLQESDIEKLTEAVEDIFDELHRSYPNTPLLLLSPLAEGADRLVAQVAIEKDGQGKSRDKLVAPLPLPQLSLASWTPEQIADGKRWVGTWKLAGADLDRIRRKELRELDTYRAITLLCGPADYTRPPRAPKPFSGLVEQQQWFTKGGRP